MISLWYQNDITFRTRSLSSIFTWQNIDLDYRKCQVILLDILHSSIASSIFTWQNILYPSCKNAEYPSYNDISHYYIVGGILHYKTFVRLWNQGYVFNSHVQSLISTFESNQIVSNSRTIQSKHPNRLRYSLRENPYIS